MQRRNAAAFVFPRCFNFPYLPGDQQFRRFAELLFRPSRQICLGVPRQTKEASAETNLLTGGVRG